jgi:hypothetical protein
VANSSVGKWFVRKRGLAIGISSIGVSFGTGSYRYAWGFNLVLLLIMATGIVSLKRHPANA